MILTPAWDGNLILKCIINMTIIFREGLIILMYYEKNLLERINKDKIVNNHGKKLIELCKLSDLKIANGRVGTDKSIGSYTCHTSRGSSTIDYAILSMGLFPHIVDLYIYIYDECLSDVHCPLCLVMSCYVR